MLCHAAAGSLQPCGQPAHHRLWPAQQCQRRCARHSGSGSSRSSSSSGSSRHSASSSHSASNSSSSSRSRHINSSSSSSSSCCSSRRPSWVPCAAAGGDPGDTSQLNAAIAAANEQTDKLNRADIYKAIAVSGAVTVLAGVLDHDWVEAHQAWAMGGLFCLGYLGIFVEEVVGLNKSGVALVMAVSLWVIRATGSTPVEAEVAAALADVSSLILFLLGAMTIVEVVDQHNGFRRLAAWVRTDQRASLAAAVAGLTFMMSAVLDNLTATIVVLGILQRAVPHDAELRKLLGSIVVVAANAGGAWSPVGDVTTTMLWVADLITPWATVRSLLLPAAVSLAVPLGVLCWTAPELQGPVVRPDGWQPPPAVSEAAEQLAALQARLDSSAAASGGGGSDSGSSSSQPELHAPAADGATAAPAVLELQSSNRDVLVLLVGLGVLLFVPLFRQLTTLPPYMGMLSGLGVLWLVTDALHFGEDRSYPRVQDALRNIDIGGVMFFLAILLSVEALDAAGLLRELATALSAALPNIDLIAAAIGLASAVIDNVPLVAASMGMFDASQAPPDGQFWQLIALCAGTGGSLLVIGSASGVALMSIEGVGFAYYLRRVSAPVLAGYVAAIALYVVTHGLPSASTAVGAL